MSTWQPVDFAALADTDTRLEPASLSRNDGVYLLYPGKTHSLASEPEAGKSWVGLITCHQHIADGRHALYIDFEDGPETALERLLAVGADLDDIIKRFHYIAPNEPIDVDAQEILEGVLVDDVAVAVIDGLTEGFGMFGLSINDNTDISTFQRALPKPIASAGVAVLMLDHVVKNRDNRGRYAIGGQHKLAGVDVAYVLEAVTPFGRDLAGMSKLVIVKDRPAYIRRHCPGGIAAELLISESDGHVEATLKAPPAGEFRPTHLMDKVSRFLETQPNGAASRRIDEASLGKAAFVRHAVQVLVREGYVTQTPGPRKSVVHTSVRPFRNEES